MDEIVTHTLPNGIALGIRPIAVSDARQFDALIQGLSANDRRWRFHGSVNGVSTRQLHALVSPELPGRLALVAVAHLPGRELLVGDARYAVDDTGCAGEFALMVATGWRELGIGQRVMQTLQAEAHAHGLRWLYGSVLADNTPMQSLMGRCGFRITPHRGDERMVLVESCLEEAGLRTGEPHAPTPGPSTRLSAADRARVPKNPSSH